MLFFYRRAISNNIKHSLPGSDYLSYGANAAEGCMKIEHHLKNFYLPPGAADQAAREAKGTDTAQAVDREGRSADKRRKREQEQRGKSKLQVERIVVGDEKPEAAGVEPEAKPNLNIVV